MTTKKLIEQLDDIVPKKPKSDWSTYQRQVVNEAIRTLEQEPAFDKILDKIRAEIDQYLFQNEFGSEYRKEVSQIIDKYKPESEE